MDHSQRMQIDTTAAYDTMFDLELEAANESSADCLDTYSLEMPVARDSHSSKDQRGAFHFVPPRSFDEAATPSSCSCDAPSILHAETLCIAGWHRLMQRPTPTLPIAIPQPMELEGSCQRIEAIYI